MSQKPRHRTVSLDQLLSLYKSGAFDEPPPEASAGHLWNGFAEIIEVPKSQVELNERLKAYYDRLNTPPHRPKLY